MDQKSWSQLLAITYKTKANYAVAGRIPAVEGQKTTVCQMLTFRDINPS